MWEYYMFKQRNWFTKCASISNHTVAWFVLSQKMASVLEGHFLWLHSALWWHRCTLYWCHHWKRTHTCFPHAWWYSDHVALFLCVACSLPSGKLYLVMPWTKLGMQNLQTCVHKSMGGHLQILFRCQVILSSYTSCESCDNLSTNGIF